MSIRINTFCVRFEIVFLFFISLILHQRTIRFFRLFCAQHTMNGEQCAMYVSKLIYYVQNNFVLLRIHLFISAVIFPLTLSHCFTDQIIATCQMFDFDLQMLWNGGHKLIASKIELNN